MKDVVVILNPWAGRGTAGQRRPDLENALQQAHVSYDLWPTHARGGATELAWQAVEKGYGTVVAVGGDGTLNEVVNGLVAAEEATGKTIRFGVVPLGTGSDFIKSLDGVEPNDITAAVQRLAQGKTRAVDLGRVTVDGGESRLFLNALGSGFDAQVAVESLKITKLKGIAVYLLAIIRTLAFYRPQHMTVQYGRRSIRRKLMFASIGNGRCQGGGFWLTPDALIDDGKLDLCIVNRLRLDQIIRYVPKVMEGSHTKLNVVTMARADTIEVEAETTMPVAVDGEVIAIDAKQIRIETLPQRLQIVS